ncbi:Dnajb9 [Symbiodinium sp. CCMP2592]|nr:Dnajb9 [Symbiodinium sp. CCMP2592]
MASPRSQVPAAGMFRSCYDQLGVERNATEIQIRRAFHMKALQWHPDKCNAPDAAEQFRRVNEAFKILSSDKSRREHDAHLEARRRPRTEPPQQAPVRPLVAPIAAFRQLLLDASVGKVVSVPEFRAWSGRCGIPFPADCIERSDLISQLLHQVEGELDRRVRLQDWSELQKAELVAWLETRGFSLKFVLQDDAVDKKKLIQIVSGYLAREPFPPPGLSAQKPAASAAYSPQMSASPTASRAPSPPPASSSSCKPSTPRAAAKKSKAKSGFSWAAFWLGASRPSGRSAVSRPFCDRGHLGRRPPEPSGNAKAEAKAKAKAEPKASKAKAAKAAKAKRKAKAQPLLSRSPRNHSRSRSRQSLCSSSQKRSKSGEAAPSTKKQAKAAAKKEPPLALPSSSSSSSSSEPSESSESSTSESSEPPKAKAKPALPPVKKPRAEGPRCPRPRKTAAEAEALAKLEELRGKLEALREARREADYPQAVPVLKELGTLDEQGRISWKHLQQSRLFTELNRVFWRQQVHGTSFGLAGALLAKWVRRREDALKSS